MAEIAELIFNVDSTSLESATDALEKLAEVVAELRELGIEVKGVLEMGESE